MQSTVMGFESITYGEYEVFFILVQEQTSRVGIQLTHLNEL